VERTNRTVKMILVNALLAAALVAALAVPGLAQLPPPSWMPNSPIMAGAQVIILWLPVPGAVKYNIYVNGQKVAEAASVQHIIAAPEAAGEYKIELASVDASGKEGARSIPGIFRIITIEPPKGLIYRIVEGKVLLRWEKAKGAVIYNVYRSGKKDGDYQLLGSVQNEDYTDSSAKKDATYYYTIAAKDLAGKESKRGEPEMVSLVEVVVAKQVVLKLKVAPSKEINKILLLGKNKVSMYGDFKIGRDGFGYMVDAGDCKVLKINLDAGEVVKVFGEAGNGEGKLTRPTKLAFDKDGRIFLGDLTGKIVVYDGEGNFQREIKMPVPDKVKDKEIYDNALEASKGSIPSPNGLLIDDQSGILYIASANYNTIFTFSLDGTFKGFIGKGGEGGISLSTPAELLMNMDGSELIVTMPAAHEVAVIDLKGKKIKYTIGIKRTGFIGGFIGMNGATMTPQGNYLFCDSGIHSIQVFDGKEYGYLYHIGGEEPTSDPEFKERAKFDFQYPVGGNFDKNGRFYVVDGLKKSISVRQVSWDKVVEVK